MPRPAEMAQFDQRFAQVSQNLDVLIEMYRSVLAEAADAPEVDLVGMGVWLRDNCEHEWLAEQLAVAIHRLHTAERSVDTARSDGSTDA